MSIENISKNHKYVEGFEEGRIVNSYRFIFPLFYNNEYVGSVETSVSIYDLLKEIQNNFDGNVDFLLSNTIVDNIVNHSINDKVDVISSDVTSNNLNKDIKILLVEDNLINQKVATVALKQLGYGNDIANNGQEAYEMYLKTKYDLILMDIQMPVLDGVGAAKRIRDYEKNNDIKKRVLIVAITANAIKTDVELYLKSGMDDVILKPFKQDELNKLLGSIT